MAATLAAAGRSDRLLPTAGVNFKPIPSRMTDKEKEEQKATRKTPISKKKGRWVEF